MMGSMCVVLLYKVFVCNIFVYRICDNVCAQHDLNFK